MPWYNKAFSWVAENVGSSVVGKICDAALPDAVSNFFRGEESQEDLHTKRSELAQKTLSDVEDDAKAAIDKQKSHLEASRRSIEKAQRALDRQNGDLTKVWSQVNETAAKMESHDLVLDDIKYSFLGLSADIKTNLTEFNWELSQLEETQKAILNQLDKVASEMKDQVKVAAAEQAAWEAQNQIVRFYEEFQLHVSVATA
ncbi:hypothetical protein H0H81_009988, partial [Sphagnurus paluster]